MKAAPSSEHWKLLPALSAEKAKVALLWFVSTGGFAVKVTLGDTVSTVQVQLAGAGSTCPTLSIARTENVWAPAERPV